MPIEPGDRQGPLNDLRVLEMGQLIAGPFCGQLLADFGAEVIKLEQPGRGDPMREWGAEKPHGKALWFPVLARNKKSVTVNAREAEGQAIVHRLAAQSDILIENFRPGTMERWNLGYDRLAEINPGIVMVRVSGYGQTGPYSQRAGYGAIGEAMGGLRYVVGDPATPPSRTGISIGDTLAATFAALGAVMAIHNRERSGRGQVVDSAIYEAVLAVMECLVTEYDIGGYVRERTGSILPMIAPSNVYPTREGKMVLIGANQDSVFGRLAEAMGEPELADRRALRHPHRARQQPDRARRAHRRLDGHPRSAGADRAAERARHPQRGHLPRARHAGRRPFQGAGSHRPHRRSGVRPDADAERRAEAFGNAGRRASDRPRARRAQRRDPRRPSRHRRGRANPPRRGGDRLARISHQDHGLRRSGRAPGRDPSGGAVRPTGCVEPLARCPRIARRGSPALSAGQRRAGHGPGEKCRLGQSTLIRRCMTGSGG